MVGKKKKNLSEVIERYRSIIPPLQFEQWFDDNVNALQSVEKEFRETSDRKIRWAPYDPYEWDQYSEGEHHPQWRFVFNDTREILFGGSAGGSKSSGMLLAALRFVDVPGYSAVIFRRTTPQLNSADSLIPRSKEWLMGTPAKWNGMDKRWTFPSGATLTFSHLQYDDSVYDHFGPAYQFIGFDEATQFTEFQYQMMLTRLRRPLEGPLSEVPLRVRLASNPGGIGHTWVKSKFMEKPTSNRLFIQSMLRDNYKLDRDSYEEMLQELPPDERDRLLHGRWDILSDGVLPWQYIEQCIDQQCLWEGYEPKEQVRGNKTKTKELYLGIDIGRTRDLTVLYTWESIEDVLYTREVKAMKGVSFAEQRNEIQARLKSPSYIRAKIDKGGIGMQLAEELEAEFPHKLEGIQLNSARQGQLAEMMKARFGNTKARIPDDPDLINDFRLVSNTVTKNGVPTIQTERNSSGHGDRFWAAALGMMAVPIKVRRRAVTAPKGIKSKV